MKRFFANLFRGRPSAGPARVGKPAPRRTSLQVDRLEDRTVMSAAFQSGSTLFINADAGGQFGGQERFISLEELNPTGNCQIEVFDSVNGLIGKFSINSINAVNIHVAGLDQVQVIDSNGMPFATGTTVSVSGSGPSNLMKLEGSRTIAGGEDYIVGGTAGTPSTILEDGLTFQFTNTIVSVTDTIPITGILDVATSGQNVSLANSALAGSQTLLGMGPGGGGILTYSGKPTVDLNEFAANANVILDAGTAGSLEKSFVAEMWGANDQATVLRTPNSTGLVTVVNAHGTQQTEHLFSNLSPVLLEGNTSTNTFIGKPVGNGQLSLKGIGANVEVIGSGFLLVSDQGNHTVAENVNMNESSISGTGLFGNNSAIIGYTGVGTLSMLTGTAADTYHVHGLSPGGTKTHINILDDSTVAFTADVTVNSKSNLELSLFNQSTAKASLVIDARNGGDFSNLNPQRGTGTEDVSYNGTLVGQIDYHGFSSIKLER